MDLCAYPGFLGRSGLEDLVFNKLALDPVCLLLGLPHTQIKGSHCQKLWNVIYNMLHVKLNEMDFK